MKCMICFFSPTRNTYNVCKNMVYILKSYGYEIDMLDVTKRELREKKNANHIFYDLYVIAFPVYSQRIPDIFSEYLQRVSINSQNAIIVSTYGSVTEGNALSQAAAILNKKNLQIYGAIALPSEHSYRSAFMSGYIYDNYNAELEFFFKNALFNKESKKAVKIRSNLAVGMFFSQRFLTGITLKIPNVIKEKCVRCNKCIQACPTNAIDINLNISANQCIRCAACVKVCEFEARECVFKNYISRIIVAKGIHRKGKPVVFT